MSIALEELIQNRQELIEAHRKNNFTAGIHALLTDLYPDTAHFIYELLQNAEDMNATVVRFVLDKQGIDFEHNGTKRNFNTDDIDAITNIGNNRQKKDDPTSIGKFGIGFKAVFAYTSTPIIHSGDYHFKIRDYFVPVIDGVEHISTIDQEGVAWTKFSFPFNNPKKPVDIAYSECLDGLRKLDATAVLFLQNIKRIEYMLPSSEIGYVQLVEDGDHHVSITYQKADEKKEHKSYWLRFSRMINMEDDRGNPKNLPIAIAFPLEIDKNQKEYIAPVKGGGRTFIYFPTEKEHSGLRFHINAPFASTVARDSVRDCDENVKLIRAIAQLIVDSLPEIKVQGLMNHAFFEVLPHDRDNLSCFYQYVWEGLYSAFRNNDYLPTKDGGYASARDALIGPPAIFNVLKEEDMRKLFDIDKVWIKNAAQKNSNADAFIRSLSVQEFTLKDFADIVGPSAQAKTEHFLSNQQNDWLKRFYVLCAVAHDALDNTSAKEFTRRMKQARVIRSTQGKMYRSFEIYFLPVNRELVTETTPIIDPTFVHSSTKADKATSDKIRSFFQYQLNVEEYGPKVEIEKMLSRYGGKIRYSDRANIEDQYFKDIITFAKYKMSYVDIDFSTQSIFLYQNNKGELVLKKASELCLGARYGNSDGDILASVYEKPCLWNGYIEHYSRKELQQFIDFASSCGILKSLSIKKQSVYLNPLYDSVLKRSGCRNTIHETNLDYTIPDMEKLLARPSIAISKAIWKTLERYGKNGGYKYVSAKYSPNGSVELGTCDSTLIYYLKRYAWLPNRQGNLCKPEDIFPSDLHPDFVYDKNNDLLVALGMGSAADRQSHEQVRLDQEAKKAGYRLVSADDYQLLQQVKKQLEKPKKNELLSGRDLLKKQQKHSAPNANAGEDFSTDGAVNNVTRREKNIEETFCNANMNPTQRKLFGRIVESTKKERTNLLSWYQGRCQMCDTVIIDYKKEPHFIAKNIINTQNLSNSIRQTTALAWNSLCLCPNCAAKYDVCSRDLNGLYEQIMQTEIIEGDIEKIILSIELDGKRQDIRYIPKHFIALKKVMTLIDDEIKK